MYRFSFTINHMRTTEEFITYRKLLEDGLFQGIEIFYPYQLDEEGMNTYTKNVYYLLEGLEDKVEVVLHLPFGGESNDLVSGKKEVFERQFLAIDYANKFNAKKLTLHLGSVHDYTQKEYLDISVNNVKRLCEYANKYGANIMIENMPAKSEVATSVEEMKYIIEHVNMPNCKFIYDTGHGHVYYKDLEKEKEFLSTLKQYLYHFHISDNDSSRDMHAAIGKGNIDFYNLFKDIKKEYNELYCLEIIYKNSDDLINYLNSLKEKLFN